MPKPRRRKVNLRAELRRIVAEVVKETMQETLQKFNNSRLANDDILMRRFERHVDGTFQQFALNYSHIYANVLTLKDDVFNTRAVIVTLYETITSLKGKEKDLCSNFVAGCRCGSPCPGKIVKDPTAVIMAREAGKKLTEQQKNGFFQKKFWDKPPALPIRVESGIQTEDYICPVCKENARENTRLMHKLADGLCRSAKAQDADYPFTPAVIDSSPSSPPRIALDGEPVDQTEDATPKSQPADSLPPTADASTESEEPAAAATSVSLPAPFSSPNDVLSSSPVAVATPPNGSLTPPSGPISGSPFGAPSSPPSAKPASYVVLDAQAAVDRIIRFGLSAPSLNPITSPPRPNPHPNQCALPRSLRRHMIKKGIFPGGSELVSSPAAEPPRDLDGSNDEQAQAVQEDALLAVAPVADGDQPAAVPAADNALSPVDAAPVAVAVVPANNAVAVPPLAVAAALNNNAVEDRRALYKMTHAEQGEMLRRLEIARGRSELALHSDIGQNFIDQLIRALRFETEDWRHALLAYLSQVDIQPDRTIQLNREEHHINSMIVSNFTADELKIRAKLVRSFWRDEDGYGESIITALEMYYLLNGAYIVWPLDECRLEKGDIVYTSLRMTEILNTDIDAYIDEDMQFVPERDLAAPVPLSAHGIIPEWKLSSIARILSHAFKSNRKTPRFLPRPTVHPDGPELIRSITNGDIDELRAHMAATGLGVHPDYAQLGRNGDLLRAALLYRDEIDSEIYGPEEPILARPDVSILHAAQPAGDQEDDGFVLVADPSVPPLMNEDEDPPEPEAVRVNAGVHPFLLEDAIREEEYQDDSPEQEPALPSDEDN